MSSKYFHVSLSDSEPLGQRQNRHGPVRRLRLWFLNFLKGALVPNFNKMADLVLLLMEVLQIEVMFSIARTNLHACILGLGTNDISWGMAVRVFFQILSPAKHFH
jgi:hypothetical protein